MCAVVDCFSMSQQGTIVQNTAAVAPKSTASLVQEDGFDMRDDFDLTESTFTRQLDSTSEGFVGKCEVKEFNGAWVGTCKAD